jgi:two-component system nitrate/nitrite response regulator NarL
MPINLIVADDHPLILDGLQKVFALQADFTVMAYCTNGEEALCAVRQYRPNVAVLDIRMPGKDGLEVLREMQQEALPTRPVMLTATLDEDEVLTAIRFGARGVVLKEMASKLLVQCIREVHAGGSWLESRAVGRALEKLSGARSAKGN